MISGTLTLIIFFTGTEKIKDEMPLISQDDTGMKRTKHYIPFPTEGKLNN